MSEITHFLIECSGMFYLPMYISKLHSMYLSKLHSLSQV